MDTNELLTTDDISKMFDPLGIIHTRYKSEWDLMDEKRGSKRKAKPLPSDVDFLEIDYDSIDISLPLVSSEGLTLFRVTYNSIKNGDGIIYLYAKDYEQVDTMTSSLNAEHMRIMEAKDFEKHKRWVNIFELSQKKNAELLKSLNKE